MIGVRQLDWVNHNTQRSYPLTTDATSIDLSGDFEIPDDFIVNIVLPVHWGLSVLTGKFFVHRIASYANGFSITIGYDSVDGVVDVATALIPRAGHFTGAYYNLTGIGDFIDSKGFVQIGKFDNIDLQPGGQFEFDLAGSRLEPDAIHPYIRGVMSVQAKNGDDLSVAAVGRIILSGGRNTRIRANIVEGEDPEFIFDAIEGIGLTEECICESNQANPVRSLSLVGPDALGNINLLGNECFSITPGPNSLIIEDKCSKPCCGCEELQKIMPTLNNFGSKATTLENFVVGLEELATSLNQVVLGSRLGDRGCVPAPDCP